MTDGDRDSSGELSSFLHLTGWRPAVLALVAGIAGAIGLFMALDEPAQWQARYIVNCNNVASEDFTPAELNSFCEEIAQSAKLANVINEVEAITGLVEEDDYEITVNQSPSSQALIDIGVVADNPEDAQLVAIETGIAAVDDSLEDRVDGLVALRDSIDTEIQAADLRIAELVAEADGFNPTIAYNRAQNDLFDRRAYDIAPPVIEVPDEEGNIVEEVLPFNGPTAPELEALVQRLEPVSREYEQLQAQLNELSLRRSDRNATIRQFNGSLGLIDNERENPFVISEVVTEEASRISGILAGVLLFAVPGAFLTILFFVVLDLFRRKPEQPGAQAEPFDAAGVLDAASTRALPEASVTTLIVVDEDEASTTTVDADAAEEASDTDADDDGSDDDENEEADDNTRSKASRWGRDAGSKAG